MTTSIAQKEKKREYDKIYGLGEKKKAYDARYRLEHKEETRLRNHKMYSVRKEEIRERTRKYALEHREEKRESKRRRRAVKSNVDGGHFSEEEWLGLLDRTGHKCLRCGATDKLLQRDHVIPLALMVPHSDEISNIQPLCASCNYSKHTKVIDYRNGA
jgi:5-methylcytosine-specific restriction endonuclease McrA